MALRAKDGLPSANYPGHIELRLDVGRERVYGSTAREFLVAAVNFLVQHGSFAKLEIPFSTSGQNYLISPIPVHPSGVKFAHFEKMKIGHLTLYVNTNHPRFFALRQGYDLLQAAGFHPRWREKS